VGGGWNPEAFDGFSVPCRLFTGQGCWLRCNVGAVSLAQDQSTSVWNWLVNCQEHVTESTLSCVMVAPCDRYCSPVVLYHVRVVLLCSARSCCVVLVYHVLVPCWLVMISVITATWWLCLAVGAHLPSVSHRAYASSSSLGSSQQQLVPKKSDSQLSILQYTLTYTMLLPRHWERHRQPIAVTCIAEHA